jgi:hypothetical protein
VARWPVTVHDRLAVGSSETSSLTVTVFPSTTGSCHV